MVLNPALRLSGNLNRSEVSRLADLLLQPEEIKDGLFLFIQGRIAGGGVRGGYTRSINDWEHGTSSYKYPHLPPERGADKRGEQREENPPPAGIQSSSGARI